MYADAIWYTKKQLPVDPFTDAELVEYMELNGFGHGILTYQYHPYTG